LLSLATASNNLVLILYIRIRRQNYVQSQKDLGNFLPVEENPGRFIHPYFSDNFVVTRPPSAINIARTKNIGGFL